MSTIDSGLGWSCDEEFYRSESGLLVSFPNGSLAKTSDGGSIVCYSQFSSYYKIVIMSTVSDYTNITPTGGDCHEEPTEQAEIDGKTWYITYGVNRTGWGQRADSFQSYPYVPNLYPMGTDERVRTILQAANVQTTAKKIPTTDYVKAFVEGVLKGMPNTVVAEYSDENLFIHGM